MQKPSQASNFETPSTSDHFPALVIDLNALIASGATPSQMQEQAQEAVRQALQHVCDDRGGYDFETDNTETNGPTGSSPSEQQSFCAIGWACASGEGRVQAAAEQALVHPLLHAAMQKPAAVSKLGVALSTMNEALPLAEVRSAMRYVAQHFSSDIEIQMDCHPDATNVPVGHIQASIWVVWSTKD
jgi:hypothetical protein